jgi:type IV pilus assembly protein PilC
MAKYKLKFRNANGDMFEEFGTYDTKIQAIESISNRGLIPLEVKKHMKFDTNNVILSNKVPLNKTADFLEMLSDTISSGLSLTSGTEEAVATTKTGYMSLVVKSIDEDIRRGVALSDAMEKFPSVFNESDVNLVRSGETTGKTAEVLARISENKRKSGDFMKSLIGSLIYPFIIVLMALVVVWVLVVYMVPVISEMYAQLDGELPYLTRLVVSISMNVTDNFILYVLVIIAIVSAIVAVLKTKSIRFKLDMYLLKFPFVGKLIITYETYKICYVLASLLEGGVATNKALDIASRVVNNRFISKEVAMVKLDVEQNGISLSSAFGKTKHAIPVFLNNVSAGERTGEISDKLMKLSTRLEKTLNKSLNTIKSTVSPILIAVLSVFVGILMFAVMSPMYSVMDYI